MEGISGPYSTDHKQTPLTHGLWVGRTGPRLSWGVGAGGLLTSLLLGLRLEEPRLLAPASAQKEHADKWITPNIRSPRWVRAEYLPSASIPYLARVNRGKEWEGKEKKKWKNNTIYQTWY